MSDELRAIPEDALADIAYFARSSNRIEILDALSAEPRSSRDLVETTAASRSTVERILTELEERGWAERTADGTYAATPAGEFAVSEFVPLVGVMEAIRTLGDAVDWLPTDELSISLRHFSDATVRRPEPNSPMAPATQMTERIREAADFRCLVCIVPTLAFERAMRDGVVDGSLTTEHVITEDELAVIEAQPDRLRRWREYVAAGADVYCYDGDIPCNLFLMDETVILVKRRPEICAFIRTENETVRSWTRDVIERYRRAADRLDAAAFTEESSVVA